MSSVYVSTLCFQNVLTLCFQNCSFRIVFWFETTFMLSAADHFRFSRFTRQRALYFNILLSFRQRAPLLRIIAVRLRMGPVYCHAHAHLLPTLIFWLTHPFQAWPSCRKHLSFISLSPPPPLSPLLLILHKHVLKFFYYTCCQFNLWLFIVKKLMSFKWFIVWYDSITSCWGPNCPQPCWLYLSSLDFNLCLCNFM